MQERPELLLDQHRESYKAEEPSSLAPAGKLRRDQARVLCWLAMRGKLSQRKLASWFRVSQPMVSYIKAGLLWGWATEDIRRVEE